MTNVTPSFSISASQRLMVRRSTPNLAARSAWEEIKGAFVTLKFSLFLSPPCGLLGHLVFLNLLNNSFLFSCDKCLRIMLADKTNSSGSIFSGNSTICGSTPNMLAIWDWEGVTVSFETLPLGLWAASLGHRVLLNLLNNSFLCSWVRWGRKKIEQK